MTRRARTLTLGVLGVATVATLAMSAALGAMNIPLLELLTIIAEALGFATSDASVAEKAVVLNIRLPRVVLGLLVGGGLAVSGAAMQAVFRNPLADPALIGVSTGAAVGVVLWLLLGATAGITSMWALPFAGFLGGIGATLLVVKLGSRDGVIDITTTLLAGIAINAFAGAVIGFAIYASDEAQLRTITSWTLGTLGGATWSTVGVVAAASALPTAYLLRQAHNFDLLVLGEAEAGHLGVDVRALQRGTFAATALLVAASVAFTGVIGFIGLVVPHLVRLVGGPSHRWVFGASLLLGVALTCGADLLSRTVAPPAEVPIGVVTAIIGAPFFVFLLMRRNGAA